MPLDDIVTVTITSQTQSVAIPNFGIPMILGTNKAFLGLVQSYSNLQEVGNDFATNAPEYVAAQNVFSQDPSPTNVLIGRRDCDTVTLNVLTGQLAQNYTVTINGFDSTVASSTLQQFSSIVWDIDFVANNLINVEVNGTTLGTITSVLDFSGDFVPLSSITATVNGIPLLPPVAWNVNQAGTIGDLATKIGTAAGVASSTVTGARQITVVFTLPGFQTVNSVVDTAVGGPTVIISEGGFTWQGTQALTIGPIATAIGALPGIFSTVVVAPRTINILGVAGLTVTVDDASVTLGASQAVATIVNDDLNDTIAKGLVTAINGNANVNTVVLATYVGVPIGTFTVSAIVSGTAYTLEASTNLTVANNIYVQITQVVVNQNYVLTLGGVDYTFLTDATIQTADQISLALVNAININTPNSGIAATDNGDGTFTATAAIPFAITIGSPEVINVIKGIRILPLVPTGSITTRLNQIESANDNWYGLILTDRTVAAVLSASTWTQSESKIFGTASNDPNIINQIVGVDTTSIAAQLQNLNRSRSFVMYHQDALTTYPEAAWMGRVLPETPGSETWKFKKLTGIAYSNLTTTQSTNVLNKNANTYEFIGGVGITQNGTTSAGEFIDIIRGQDWLISVIQTNVFFTLVNSPKVPYTDAGIMTIQSQVQKALQLGVDNNFLTNNPAPITTVPLAVNCSPVDKAARILRNVNFTATLAGAIHVVKISGTVSV
jgi:hypothetical protein